jgi:hypothetical protein
MSKGINSDFLNPKEITLLAFGQFDGKPSVTPRKIKGGELRFPALDDKKKTIDPKLLESLRDFKGEKENLWKYIIDFYNAALKEEIPDIFKLLEIPKVLAGIVLEYATRGYSVIDSSDKAQEIKSWSQITGADGPWYFPWQNDTSLTQSLIENEFYRPLKRKLIPVLPLFLPHLPDILDFLPPTIVKLISDYIDICEQSPRRSEVVNAIKSFIEGYQEFLREILGAEGSFEYRLLSESYFAISALRDYSVFEPMNECKILGNRFSIKNALDFLAVMVTQPVCLSNPDAPMTLFGHILRNFDSLNMYLINRIAGFFNNVKALCESTYGIAMNKDAFASYSLPKTIILPFEKIGHHFPVTALQDEKGELRFPILPEDNLQINWSLRLMAGLRECSEESMLESVFRKIRPNSESDILIQALPRDALNGYNPDRNYDYPVHFPWVNDEKHQQLTHFLIEEEIYKSQPRKDLISKTLMYVLPLPAVVVSIIDGYVGEEKQPGKEWVIDQVKVFFDELAQILTKSCGYVHEYNLLQIFQRALEDIRDNSGFKTFYTGPKSTFLRGLPRGNAFDFLVAIVTQQIPGPETPRTIFELVINLLDRIKTPTLRQVPEVFYMVKSLVDSAYILSGNIPSHVGFYLTQDMAESLYIHVNRRLQQGLYINELHNRGNRPILLMTTLRLLKENVPEKNVQFNRKNGFIIFLLDAATGVRLLNYHKRAKALDIVYNYINESKISSSIFSWFGNKNRSNEAKDLATRIVNIPGLEVPLISEIEQSPLFNSNEPYARVLHQVRATLIDDLRGPALTLFQQQSTQQELAVQSTFKLKK